MIYSLNARRLYIIKARSVAHWRSLKSPLSVQDKNQIAARNAKYNLWGRASFRVHQVEGRRGAMSRSDQMKTGRKPSVDLALLALARRRLR